MYLYTWYQWLLFFFIYCFLGWIIESSYVSLKSRHFVNRGFLRLPLLPLYGSGAIIMLWVSLPVQNYLPLVFLFGMIGASILEYFTGWAMERLFKMKYWDYSQNPFNLNGYICLGTSLAWGGLTILMTEFIHRPIEHMVLKLHPYVCIGLVLFIGAAFAVDAFYSTKEALALGHALESMTRLKAELEEAQLQLALLKAETSEKVTELREETRHKAANLKSETAVKMEALKAETALLRNELRGEAANNPRESALKERLQSLTETRERLFRHVSLYRKELLLGNPTASSKRFGEALRELKESLKKRR